MDDLAGGYRGTDPIFVQWQAIILGFASLALVAIYPLPTLYLVAAGVFGACVQLGGIDDLCRAFGHFAHRGILLYAAGII